MKPELTSFLHLGSYSVLLLAGCLVGYALTRARAARQGIETHHIDNLCLLLSGSGLLGARLFSRAFYLPHQHWWEPWLLWRGGGLVFYGGLIAAIAALGVYSLARGLNVRELADSFAPGLALGLAFGRVGCFLAGCCWGDVCTDPQQLDALADATTRFQIQTAPALSPPGFWLAVRFPSGSAPYQQQQELGLIRAGAAESLPVHPTQLYEAVFAAVLGIWCHRAFGRRRFPGQIALELVFGYSLGRWVLEIFRADNPPVYGGMTFSQVVSLALMAAAGAAAWMARGTRRPPGAAADGESGGAQKKAMAKVCHFEAKST